MADLPGYISDTELYYEESSGNNLLTGSRHTVTGSNNVIAGADGTLTGDRTVLLNLDGTIRSVTRSGALEVWGSIYYNGTLLSTSAGDINALLDSLGT